MQPPVIETADTIVDLLRRVAARDRAAFATLYKATAAKLHGVIIRILQRRAVADEILQDVFLKIWNAAGDYDAARGSPIAWMASIARNRAIDEVRRAVPVSLEDAPETLELASGAEDALTTLAAKQDLRRLLACMDLLEKERREMIVLAYFQGFSRDALAVRFGRPVATIKTWLHRSVAHLKDCVGS